MVDQVAGISDLVSASKNLNLQMAQLIAVVKASFPQSLGVSSSASGGAATLPANPVGFISVVNPATGATVKVPYYA